MSWACRKISNDRAKLKEALRKALTQYDGTINVRVAEAIDMLVDAFPENKNFFLDVDTSGHISVDGSYSNARIEIKTFDGATFINE